MSVAEEDFANELVNLWISNDPNKRDFVIQALANSSPALMATMLIALELKYGVKAFVPYQRELLRSLVGYVVTTEDVISSQRGSEIEAPSVGDGNVSSAETTNEPMPPQLAQGENSAD